MTKDIWPFKVNLKIDTKNLIDVPAEMSSQEIFKNWLIRVIVIYSNENKGLSMFEQKRLYRMRQALEVAVKLKDDFCEFEPEDFRWIIKLLNEIRIPAEGNEIIMLIDASLRAAQSEHDTEVKE